MASRFDLDTAVGPTGDGTFAARIDPGWWIVDGPNGGYVAAILLRAGQAVLDGASRRPLIVTVHYARKPREGPVTVQATVERVGRRVATVTARMDQDDRMLALATLTFTSPADEVLGHCAVAVPEVPPPEECEPFPPPDAALRIPLNDRYEQRWALGDPPFSGSERAEAGGWLRTEDAREVDALLATAFADGWIPPLFALADEPGSLAVPTVELTVHLHGGLPRPAGEWVLAHFRSPVAVGGYVEESGELWSRDGRLLARVRQLGVVTRVGG